MKYPSLHLSIEDAAPKIESKRPSQMAHSAFCTTSKIFMDGPVAFTSSKATQKYVVKNTLSLNYHQKSLKYKQFCSPGLSKLH